ncbi:MAG: O-antigen ligase family protein [Deltaproteobacteria bacterium]|nr:O-antigen ligase family protein [Deltaproteobacteria bacterium]
MIPKFAQLARFQWALLGLLFILLFTACNPWGQELFLLPKEVIAIWLALFFCWLGVSRVFFSPAGTIKPIVATVPAALPICLLLAWCLILIPFSTSPILSLRFFLHLTLFAGLYFCLPLVLKQDSVLVCWGFLIVGGLVTSVAGLAQYYGYLPDTIHPFRGLRSTGFFFSNPNHYGAVVGSVLLLALGLIFTQKFNRWRWLVIFIFALLLLSLFYTKTLGSIFPAIAAVCFFFFLSRRTILKNGVVARRYLILLGFLGLTLATIFIVFFLGERLSQVVHMVMSADYNRALSTRLTAVEAAWAMVLDRPLTGVGPGAFVAAFFDYRSWIVVFAGGINDDVGLFDAVHNDHMQVLAELGMPGIFFWIWILVSIGKHLVKALRNPLVNFDIRIILISGSSSLLFLLMNALVHFPFHIVTSAFIFIFVLGSVVTVTLPQSESAWAPIGDLAMRGRLARPALNLFFGLVAVIVFLPVVGDVLFVQGRTHLERAYQLESKSPGESSSEFDSALKTFKLAKRLSPYHHLVRRGLAEIYDRRKEYSLAYEQCLTQHDLRRNEATACMLAMSRYHIGGDIFAAKRLINLALVFNPIYASGWSCLEYLNDLPQEGKP